MFFLNPKLDKSSEGDKLLWTSVPVPSGLLARSLPGLPLDSLPGVGLLETEEQSSYSALHIKALL